MAWSSLLRLWAVAFAVRLVGVAVGLLLFPSWLVPPDTSSAYLPIARSLAAEWSFQTGPSVNCTIPPLFPFWLAGLMQLTGPEVPVWFAGLFHAALRAAGVVLVYLLGQRYFGARAGLWGALLYLLDPWEAFWAAFLIKEQLGVPLFLLAVWLLVRLDDRRSLRSAAAAGAAIGLATLARFPSCGLWAAAFLLLFRLSRLPGGWCWGNLRRTAGLLLVLTTALLAALAPWLVRNWVLIGQPVLSAHFAGQYFYTSNGPGIEMENDGYYSPRGIDGQVMSEAKAGRSLWQKEGYLFSRTLDHVVKNPGEALQRVRTKIVNMWQPTFGQSSLRNWLLLGVPYCVMLGVCLAGLGIAWRRRLPCAGVLLPLLVFFLIHLVFWGEIRNRQYLMPLLFVFGGLALAVGTRRDSLSALRDPRRRSMTPSG